MTVCFNVATWFTLSHVLILSVTSTDLDLSGDHIPVPEGAVLTLFCNRTIKDVPPLTGVKWYRNTEKILQTILRGDPHYTTNTSGYDEVSGRIRVTTNEQTHTVMLQINARLDDGSVWRCGATGYYSNNLTVEVLIPTTVATPGNGHTPENTLVTTAARHGSISTDKSPSGIPNVSTIVGSSAGTAIVCFLIVFAVICIKHIAGSREQDMNTINSDPDTSGLIPDDIGSDVNVQYSNINIITEATGTDVNNQYSNSSVIIGTTRSDVTNQYSNSSVISGTTRSDVNNQYSNSSVIIGTTRSDVTNQYSNSSVISGTTRSDVNNQYSNSSVIIGTTRSDVNNQYSNSNVITGATRSDVTNQYSNSNVISGATRTDVNNQYSNSSVITGTTGTDVNNQYSNSSVISGTTRSDVNNEYSTADVPSNEDRQYRCLTDTDEYITATFDLTEHID